MHAVCKRLYVVYTCQVCVSSLREYTTRFFGALGSELPEEMAGSASVLEATERMLHIASEEPLLDPAANDTITQAYKKTRCPCTRAFSCYEPCQFECPLECVSAAVGVQCMSETRAHPLFTIGNVSYRYIHPYRRRFAEADPLFQRAHRVGQVARSRPSR